VEVLINPYLKTRSGVSNRIIIALDRDGTIIYDIGYCDNFDFMLFNYRLISELLLETVGNVVTVVTNQSGIGRGFYSVADFHRETDSMLLFLSLCGLDIDRVVFCPHHPEIKCDCRKPSPKMLQYLMDHYINCYSLIYFGDSTSDRESVKALCNSKSHFEEVKIYKSFEWK